MNRPSVLTLVVLSLSCVRSSTPPAPGVRAAPAEAPLIDREIFFGDPDISRTRLSPDGRFITFFKPYRGVVNLWIKRREEPFTAAHPLTAEPRPLAASFWSRDGRWVLFAHDAGGDENFHLFAVDPLAGAVAATGVPAARDLTPGAKVRASILSVPHDSPDEVLVGLNERDPQVSDVYRLSISTGKKELVLENTQNVAGWDLDHSGKVRLAERMNEKGGNEILRVEGQKLVPLTSCSAEETCEVIGFLPDGKHAYLQTNRGARDLQALVLLDLATGAEQLLEEDPEHQVDLSGAVISDRDGSLLSTLYQGDRLREYSKDPLHAKDLARLREVLPEGDLNFVQSTADEQVWLVAVTSDVDPGAVYVYERASGKVELLYRPRPELPSQQLAPMKPVRITARDGVTLSAYLTVPLGASGPRPAVLLVHGGPWVRDEWGYDAETQFLANRGYVVLQVNYRGSSGYGKKFLNLGNGQWGTGTMQHDLTDAAQWLVSEGLSAKGQLAIMGASYGGYATLAGLAFTPDLFCAGVDIVGPSNLLTLLGSLPPYWAPVKKTFAVRVGDPENPVELERLKQQSPLNSAQAITAPLLVIQGANDPRVKRFEADSIVAAQQQLGHAVEYLVAPDEGHGFQGRENRLATYVAVERFLARHLHGRQEQAVSEPIAAKLKALTVDPATVKPALATSAPTLPAPAFDGARFGASGPLRYRVSGRIGAQPVEGSTQVAVKKERSGWTVTALERLSTGEAADATTLAATTLLPTTRTIKQGPVTVQLAYEGHAVHGTLDAGEGRTLPLQGASEQTLVTDGFSLALSLATLPLSPGYSAGVGSLQLMTGQVRQLKLAVVGLEPLTVPAGRFEAYRVDLTLEDASVATSVWVEKGPRRRVLKVAQLLPGGQGSVSSELE